jgi:hypothetical protein
LKETAANHETVTIDGCDVFKEPAKLRRIGGSRSDDWNNALLNQCADALGIAHFAEEDRDRLCRATILGLAGINPKDELEGMIAAQLIAGHNAAMDCFRRATLPGQSFEGRRENLTQANKLSRTYAALLDALNRHRGKGQQKVTVEHVHVHSGGQAIVGAVRTPRGRVRQNSEAQPHAKEIAHAPQPPMRSADARGDSLQVPGNAKRPVPDAWRSITGGSEG